jgi:hypothetical protein
MPTEIRQESEIGQSESTRAEIQTSDSPFADPNSRLKGRYKIPQEVEPSLQDITRNRPE